jgi:hypothetical protein
MINNDCTDYSFIDINIAHQVCEALKISSLKLKKSRELKSYDERRSKNSTHVIYSSMTIEDHTQSSTFMMIIKLNQHLIILKKSWMKRHDVNYHDHDDSISFYFDHCNHLKASEHFYSNQTKKKDFYSKRIFFDQSEIIENKEIKIFLEKINNSLKIIFKRSKSIKSNKRLIQRRWINESWRKNLKKNRDSLIKNFIKEFTKKFFLWWNFIY